MDLDERGARKEHAIKELTETLSWCLDTTQEWQLLITVAELRGKVWEADCVGN